MYVEEARGGGGKGHLCSLFCNHSRVFQNRKGQNLLSETEVVVLWSRKSEIGLKLTFSTEEKLMVVYGMLYVLRRSKREKSPQRSTPSV